MKYDKLIMKYENIYLLKGRGMKSGLCEQKRPMLRRSLPSRDCNPFLKTTKQSFTGEHFKEIHFLKLRISNLTNLRKDVCPPYLGKSMYVNQRRKLYVQRIFARQTREVNLCNTNEDTSLISLSDWWAQAKWLSLSSSYI